MNIPRVRVDRRTLDTLEDGSEFIFFDEANAELGYQVRVWVENGSMYASMSNVVGTGRTGIVRRIGEMTSIA